MERDIVQFVPFREFSSNFIDLAKQTLEEIPKQLTSYMNSKGILPEKPQLATMFKCSYFEALKADFVKNLVSSGFQNDRIEEMLGKGLPENSLDLFRTHVFNPSFRNPLSEMNGYLK